MQEITMQEHIFMVRRMTSLYKILRAAERKGANISNVLSEITGRAVNGKKHLNHVVENEYHS